jgi:transposase InsO family protein
LKHPFTAQGVAKVFLDNVVKLHGMPRTIESDRDKLFTSQFWKQLISLMGVKQQLSTAYRPQTDGQSERVNQCLEMYLRCVIHA